MALQKGFKSFIIRIVVLVAIVMVLGVFVKLYVENTAFYIENVKLSSEFVKASHIISPMYLINSAIFGIVCLILLLRKKLMKIKKPGLEVNQIYFGVLAVSMFFLNFFYRYIVNQNPSFMLHAQFWGALLMLIYIFFAISLGLAVFGWNYFKYFYKNFRKEILLTLVLSVVFFFVMMLLFNLWAVFSTMTGKILYWLLGLFYRDVAFNPHVAVNVSGETGPWLYLNGFSAVIYRACSGIDSLLLYMTVFALIIIMDHKSMKLKPTAIFFIIGAIGMFFVNVLRLFLLFIIGAFFNAKLALGLFHANIGWVLFLGYFILYWLVIRKHLYK